MPHRRTAPLRALAAAVLLALSGAVAAAAQIKPLPQPDLSALPEEARQVLTETRRQFEDARPNLVGLYLAGRLAGEKEDILEALDILKSWYRDLLVFRETGGAGALVHHDRAGDIGRLAPAMSGESLLGAVRAIRTAAEAIERNANKPLTLETMVFTLFADKANFVEDSRRGPRAAGPGR